MSQSDHDDDERIVQTGDACRLLGISANTIRRWVEAGALPNRRSPGGRRLYRVGDLRKLIAEQPVEPAAGEPGVPDPRTPPDDDPDPARFDAGPQTDRMAYDRATAGVR